MAAGLAIFGGGVFVINDNMTAGELNGLTDSKFGFSASYKPVLSI